ncbi:1-acyl-sn-glycerol-3-phosphate acyltransferase [Motiliproteus sediminis]|uniref:1-acyl-sn-glycerol-3-phosphate acyltransferase n=1 Tax=Motiliproteus sediminis TaxID=1468178 RepID=UPI001AEFD8ED|nr:1-acyl-sn-glycerol-3-phosphate acyltransferase [Motiliproteus sediminis]
MSENPQDPYADIRPYNDDEVGPVVVRLLGNAEFIDALTRFRFPLSSRWVGFLLRPLVRGVLKRELSGVDSIDTMQQVIASYMQRMIERTTGELSFSGLDRLEPDSAYLFISNHRDIAMDPAFVNWGLFHHGLQTVRIAIGDNLLRKPYVSDLMRLNKSFIVKRSAKGVREKLAALMELSSYINHSVHSGHSIWIAQREGRAKDGNDQTDPAILKMLHVSQKKGATFAEAVKKLNIVPVAISYEYDPCDAAKARELRALDAEGSYEKSQFEDIDSIARGITGYKGDVHVAFGEPVQGEFDTAEALAAEIDRQIHANYKLHSSNLIAAGDTAGVSADKQQQYQQRISELDEGARTWFERMYAYPVINQRTGMES